MNYVLDTNVLSALMRGDEAILARLRATAKNRTHVPNPVLAEIAYGLERLSQSKRKDRLLQQYDRICGEFLRAPWTDEVSRHFGSCKASLEKRGERIEDFDIAIAAHALAAQATLVTANTKHMFRIPNLRLEDWGTRR